MECSYAQVRVPFLQVPSSGHKVTLSLCCRQAGLLDPLSESPARQVAEGLWLHRPQHSDDLTLCPSPISLALCPYVRNLLPTPALASTIDGLPLAVGTLADRARHNSYA